MQIEKNIFPSQINFGSDHILFVEGKEDSIDSEVLSNILPIKVQALGPSYNIMSVAQAFANVQPIYYFIIDRDHHSAEVVEDYWSKFPNTDTPNILIWRKKEIENYFLDSSFLSKSSYFVTDKTEDDLQKIILKQANRYLYMAAVNYTIISIREELKSNWIEIFKNVDEFKTEAEALEKLLTIRNFSEFQQKVSDKLKDEQIQSIFASYITLATGGEETLKWGKGKWLDLLPGKNILHSVLGTALFVVKNRNGISLTGREKEQEIIKDLLTKTEHLPSDFIQLATLLKKRTGK